LAKRPHSRLATPRGCEWIRPILIPSKHASLDPHESAPQTASRSRFSRFCAAYLCAQHIQHIDTDAQTTLRVTSVILSNKEVYQMRSKLTQLLIVEFFL